MPRETIATSTKVDSLLRANAELQLRMYQLEKRLEEEQQIGRSFNAQMKLDLEEIKDQLNALHQALADAGVAAAYRYERPAGGRETARAGYPGPGASWGTEDEAAAGGDSMIVPAGEGAGAATGDTAGVGRERGGAVPSPEEIHHQIYLDFSRREYQLALEESDIFIEAYPDHPLGEEVRFIRGESLLEQQKYFDALNEFATILQLYPRGKKVPAVLLRMAISYEKIGEEEIAAGVVKRLRREYPYSEEAAIAEERFRDLLEE
jgi:TolA-binding protein